MPSCTASKVGNGHIGKEDTMGDHHLNSIFSQSQAIVHGPARGPGMSSGWVKGILIAVRS